MGLQTFTANKDVNDSVINQIVLATERPKLTVKCGRAAATLRSLVPLYPIRLAANFVQPLLCDLRKPQKSLHLLSDPLVTLQRRDTKDK